MDYRWGGSVPMEGKCIARDSFLIIRFLQIDSHVLACPSLGPELLSPLLSYLIQMMVTHFGRCLNCINVMNLRTLAEGDDSSHEICHKRD